MFHTEDSTGLGPNLGALRHVGSRQHSRRLQRQDKQVHPTSVATSVVRT